MIEAATIRTRAIMEDLLNAITVEAVNRGKSATGGFVNGLRSTVLSGDTYIVAEGRAPEHWRYVGNGRGPGKQPPIKSLQPWLRAKGIDPRAAFGIARKIGKEGSEDYRRKGENVVSKTVARFITENRFDLSPELGKAIREQVLEDFTKLKKAA